MTSERSVGAVKPWVVTATLCGLVTVPAFAQQQKLGRKTGGPAPTVQTTEAKPERRLVFPNGYEDFDELEDGQALSSLLGWTLVAEPTDLNVCGESSSQRRWLHVEDLDPTPAVVGFDSPVMTALGPWDYRYSFHFNLQEAPSPGAHSDISVHHADGTDFQDAWGIRFEAGGASLYVTSFGGTADSVAIPGMSPLPPADLWCTIDVIVELTENRITASIDDGPPVSLSINPLSSDFDASSLKLAYRSQGAGNLTTFLLDDVGIQFMAPDCRQCFDLDFETEDDFLTPLLNGQDISSPPEFGNLVTIVSSGGLGAAIYDSNPAGPNNPSQDPDLLVNLGNVLMVQNDNAPMQTVPGIFDFPNDDPDGGNLTFLFSTPAQPLSINLIDFCPTPGEGATLVLTDGNLNTRTYMVPPGFTEDIVVDGGTGFRTLDLTTMAPQMGFMAMATSMEDVGYDGSNVVSLSIDILSSGAVDSLTFCIPCVTLNFDTDDDGDVLVDGQEITTPPEFGTLVNLSSMGPNIGLAIFDSTPGGPNDPSQDPDLLVGTGNLLILQNSNAPQQSIPDIYDFPNDDADGGTIIFDFLAPVAPLRLDLADIDPSPGNAVTVTLIDSSNLTRIFSVPDGFTGDITINGPPGFRTLDLTNLAPQMGFSASATGVDQPGFDPTSVETVEVFFESSGAMDNFCFCL